jgi:hypothetical protein
MSFSIVLLSALDTFGETLSIGYTDRGWYDATGFHDPLNKNYAVGRALYQFGVQESRNFFVFDLSGIAKPITSATLTLFDPLYISDAPSENYELHDVVTSIPKMIAGTGGLDAFDDLGSGVVYGSRTMTAAENPTAHYTVPVTASINIPLNSSAIDALNNATGLFAIGGSLTTLNDQPNEEAVFGFSDLVEMSQGMLQLTAAPEPSSIALLAFSAMIFGVRRLRKRSI